jgi:EmrB/QacA subfamily drug resistance transporter
MEGEARHSVRPGLILAVLSLGACAYTLLQSLVIPALPALQQDLHASTSGIAWVFTAYLLAASIVTPIAGRLGDMFGKKRVLVVTLAGLAAGSLLAAVVTTLPLMIVARAVQGLGGAIFPLAFGIIRDEFPRERVPGALGLMSGIFAIGAGLGILLAGPILENLNYHWLFWIPFVVTVLTTLATVFFVPESPIRAPGDVFWRGAVLLSSWLTALLLGISKAPDWGWADAKTLSLFALAAVLAIVWVRAESRARYPLVDMPMMRLRTVWTTNTATALLGFAMYGAFVLIPQYVAAPASTGYGLGATVTDAGFYLLPSTIATVVFSPIGGRLSRAVGSKVPLLVGTVATTLAFVLLAVADTSWEIYVSSALLGTGLGFAISAIANLIVGAVRPDQTGVASGMNTIVRTIGGAIGAAVAATILAANTLASGYPDRHGYTVTFTMFAVAMAFGVVASIAVPGRLRGALPAATPPSPAPASTT